MIVPAVTGVIFGTSVRSGKESGGSLGAGSSSQSTLKPPRSRSCIDGRNCASSGSGYGSRAVVSWEGSQSIPERCSESSGTPECQLGLRGILPQPNEWGPSGCGLEPTLE